MAKDSYWFKHDSTAGRGLRMRKMAHIHGHWGKGVYWDVIEILRDQAGYKFDYDDTSLQMLCDLIGCKDEAKFITWMRDCVQIDLFQVSKGKFYSAILCENMAFWEKQKRNGSQSTSQKRAKVKAKPDHNSIEIIEQDRILDNSTEIINNSSEQSSGLYQSLNKIYFDWHKNRMGVNPQFDGSDGTALKQLIKYFQSLEAGDENVIKNFTALLSNFDKWDKFHQGQTRLRQINSNLTNIINLLKNGKPGARNGITKEGLINAFQKRTQSANVDSSAGG